MNSSKKIIITGAILGALSVGLGAFGAHALKDLLVKNGRLETYDLAVKYQFYHTLALLMLAALKEHLNVRFAVWSGWCFLFGTILFSGSLYILSLSGLTLWGAVTPFGGILLISGWIMFAISADKA